jgi:hypothetical protein
MLIHWGVFANREYIEFLPISVQFCRTSPREPPFSIILLLILSVKFISFTSKLFPYRNIGEQPEGKLKKPQIWLSDDREKNVGYST